MKRIDFLRKARNTHGYKYNYINLPFKFTLNDYIDIEYGGHVYNQKVLKHINGKSPEKAIPKKTTEDFIKESKEIWDDKYDYSLTEYTGALDMVKIIYDGVVYEQRASSHLNGKSPEFRKTEEFLLKDIIRNGDKKGKDEIEEFLLKYELHYQRRYYISSMEFDFYLTESRTIIEFMGRHHYEPIEEIGGLLVYKNIITDDIIKSNYCEDNYINLIRIKYTDIDNIYKILWNNLKNYL